jgi:hypothetical protein
MFSKAGRRGTAARELEPQNLSFPKPRITGVGSNSGSRLSRKLRHNGIMPTTSSDLPSLIEQLRSKSSPKRRSAALKLRKLGSRAAGPALLDALKSELKDPRTWETQYQMIMALGHSGTTEAIPLLEILAHEPFVGRTMVLVAIGDALVRLSRSSDTDAGPVLKLLSIANVGSLHDGALRAVAMLRMRFDDAETREIIRAVDAAEVESRKFWLIAACPGWSGSEVDRFVERCLSSTRADVREAAADAKLKKYHNWRPL